MKLPEIEVRIIFLIAVFLFPKPAGFINASFFIRDDNCWKTGTWAGDFHQFRSNFVARWEYRLGSFIYFVWSGERTGNNDLSGISIGESYKQLKDVFPDNVFLIKLNYWFSL